MSNASAWKRAGHIALWLGALLLLLLAAGWLPHVLIPQPAVGVIRLNSDIWAGSNVLVQAQIEEARQDERIKAVVMQFDSPGGEVVASQDIYLELENLRREMPVVGSIDSMAASGAYYAAMGTDPIYAKPSSSVGNVGVWAYFPEDYGVNDVILASGPFKLSGSSREEFLRALDEIKQEFLETVFSHRGDRLDASRSEISQGLIYTGREAAQLGLIDHIGTETEAIAAAARQAGIANYEVIDLELRVYDELYADSSGSTMEPWIGAADPRTGARSLPYGIYLLYDDVLIRGAQ